MFDPCSGNYILKKEREKERKQEDSQLKLIEFNETENIRLLWRRMRGSLNSPSYLVRNPTLAPQLEKTHETPPSSREEGHL